MNSLFLSKKRMAKRSSFIAYILVAIFLSFSPVSLAEPSIAVSATKTPSFSQSNSEKINAAYWFDKLKTALTQSHFEASIVVFKNGKTESYQWLHGLVPSGNKDNELLEVEKIAPLIGGGITMIRHNQRVASFTANKEAYSLNSISIRRFIPPIFYQDASKLIDSYQFVLVSKSQIAGRSAQLIRIESINNLSYNYWVWVDVNSGLPLRMSYVSEDGQIQEQILMTHLNLYPQAFPELQQLAEITLPEPVNLSMARQQQTNNWDISWIPKGFELIKSDRHHVSISREVSDYYLFSDGLTEISVYIQRPLGSFSEPVVLKNGATSMVMRHAGGFDVSVVGKVPLKTVYKMAFSVKRS